MDAALVRQVWQRADSCCEYCRIPQKYDDSSFEIDHVIARKHRGLTVPGNLALSCFHCNSHKGSDIGGRDPRTRRLTPFFNPRRHRWHRHFHWRGVYIIGRAPIGRVTVMLLNMNDPLRDALRKSLLDEGILP